MTPLSPIHNKEALVSHFIDPIKKSWDQEKLKLCIPAHQLQKVCKVPISLTNARDKLIWKATRFGKYTVKSGYVVQNAVRPIANLSRPSCSYTPASFMWKKLWSIPTLPKVRIFMWKALRNWIACRANLVKRKCSSNLLCPMCESAEETIEHLLFHCPWSKAVSLQQK